MRYAIIPVTAFEQNCTLLWCVDTMRAVVIDPGGDVDNILEVVTAEGVTVETVLLTHGHIDHVGGAVELARRLGVEIEGPHLDDKYWLDQLADQGRMFGVRATSGFTPSRWLGDGDVVRVGDQTLDVIHCPGHTPGHVVFYHAPSQLAQVGDVLFQGSIGRTDFPGGDHAALIRSIRERLLPLGDNVTFVPGHGPTSTFGVESRTNPFLT